MATGSSSGGGGGGKVVPDSVMEGVKRTSANMDEFQANLKELLSYCDAQTLAKLDPLERARVLLLLAKANTTLFAVRLRCKGIDPDDHSIKKDFERLSLYEEKLHKSEALSKAPLRPSATINPQAAARFIEHSLPDLSTEQKKSMREISRGGSSSFSYVERNSQKKRKYQSSEKQSVQSAAKEFLQKAALELLGDNKNGIKGPLQQTVDSDDDVVILD